METFLMENKIYWLDDEGHPY